MMIQNFNIFQADYEGVAPWRGVDGANGKGIHPVIKTVIPVQFQSDVKALCDYAGVDRLERGMTIKMTLQEILTVIPKKRRRIESYKSLIAFLNEEMGVSLELNSKKTKANGKERKY